MVKASDIATRSDSRFSVKAIWAMNWAYVRMWHRLLVPIPCPVPKEGPGILICNHLSSLDPMLVQAHCPRVIHWMIAREYYEQGSLRWLLDVAGLIPVDRSGRDTAAIRKALALLEAGGILGIFPEGKIETDGQLLPFQPGILLLATKSGAPIYPMCLEGSQRGRGMLAAYFRRNRAALVFGPPMTLSRQEITKERSEATMTGLRMSIEKLHEQCLAALKKQRF
jgi:1-acyl-sn-glycerol-3-phosphate acyltransferase